MTVTFENLSGNSDGWWWDFGDGEVSEDWSPTHVYTESGIYWACLEVYNTWGWDYYCAPILVDIEAPENDTCETSAGIVTDEPVWGSTLGATWSGVPYCGWEEWEGEPVEGEPAPEGEWWPKKAQKSAKNTSGAKWWGDADVWYVWTADFTGEAMAHTCEYANFDTMIDVYTECGGEAIACNDDMCDDMSLVNFWAEEGTTYSIRVMGFGGEMGEFLLTVAAYKEPEWPYAYFEASPMQGESPLTAGSSLNCPGTHRDRMKSASPNVRIAAMNKGRFLPGPP